MKNDFRVTWGILVVAVAFGMALWVGEQCDPPPPAPDESAVRDACVASLHNIRQTVKSILTSYPGTFDHLGEGSINENTLTLSFPVIDESRKTLAMPWRGRGWRSPRGEDGLTFGFVHPISGQPPRFYSARWSYIDVGYYWSWQWAHREFPAELQQKIVDAAKMSCGEIDKTSSHLIHVDLDRRSDRAFTLRGNVGLELSITRSREKDEHVLTIVERNITKASIIPVSPGSGTLMVDDFEFSQIAHQRQVSGHCDPFTYLKPGEARVVATHSLGRLPAGQRAIRVIWHHDEHGWTDYTPTACDGPPAHREIEGAWLGDIVSNVLAITVK